MQKFTFKTFLEVFALLLLIYIWINIKLIKKDVQELKELKTDTVKVTMYTTDPRQTDATPFITASGFHLDKKNPKKHRIVAISRDLKEKLSYGDKIRLTGIGKYSGVYYVHDLMNKRFKNRVDILINPKEKAISFDSVKVVML